MIAVPRNAHLLDTSGRLNAGDYVALRWPVLEHLTAAKLVSDMSTEAAARGSLQWTDEICGRPQSMRKLGLTGPR